MKRLSARQVRQSLVGRGNIRSLLSDRIIHWDPYSADTHRYFKSVYEEEALKGWLRVKKLFEGVSSVIALENTCSVIGHSPELIGFLFKGVSLENEKNTKKRADQLSKILPLATDHDQLRTLLSEKTSLDTPDLLHLEGFSSDVRLRWGLAHRTKAKATNLEKLNCTSLISDLSVSEISKYLIEAAAKPVSQDLNRLTRDELISLHDRAFRIFLSDRSLINLIYKPVDEAEVFGLVESQKKYQTDLTSVLKIYRLIKERNWEGVSEEAEIIEVDQITRLAVKGAELAFEVEKNKHSQKNNRIWTKMSPIGYSNLISLLPKQLINKYWTSSHEEISSKLELGEIDVQEFSQLDIQQLNESWGKDTQERLIEAGRFRAIPIYQPVWKSQVLEVQLKAAASFDIDALKFLNEHISEIKNPQIYLASLVVIDSKKFSNQLRSFANFRLHRWGKGVDGIKNWDQFISSEIGSEIWKAAQESSHIDPTNLDQVFFVFESGYKNRRKKIFLSEFETALRNCKTFSADDAVRLMACIDIDPNCLKQVSSAFSKKILNKIIGLDGTECSNTALRSLYKYVAEEYKADLWVKQAQLVNESEHLIEICLEGINRGYQLDWMHHLRQVSGSNESRARALVLVTKNDPTRLGKIRSDFTDEVMTKALSWGASVLPDICTIEKTYLELLSCIGIRHAKTLQWLLIQRLSASASGSKFDQLYEKYEILKKSGKTRKISAPIAGLKRIQKSIDVTLLQPLGAHDAAFGFVKGKSIVDNAKAHTGKQVVVNADVKNCFPSVRWPLVQAALKRDLSNKLSARSISAIVDICTAEGVLPIGAPTSPSLLNRVLHKTDEILSDQAIRRGCSYSRYADDLTFSGDDRAVGMLGIAKSVLLKISLELDPVKTNIFRRGRRQMCTGLVVNDTVNVPRRIRRRIRASVHAYEQSNKLHWNGEVVGPTALRGRLEFLKMVSKVSAEQLIDRFDAVNSNVKMKKSKTKKSGVSHRK